MYEYPEFTEEQLKRHRERFTDAECLRLIDNYYRQAGHDMPTYITPVEIYSRPSSVLSMS